MKKWRVRIWCLTASYVVKIQATDQEEAVREARRQAMNDMKHWNYTATEDI